MIGARTVESIMQIYASKFTRGLKAEFYGSVSTAASVCANTLACPLIAINDNYCYQISAVVVVLIISLFCLVHAKLSFSFMAHSNSHMKLTSYLSDLCLTEIRCACA